MFSGLIAYRGTIAAIDRVAEGGATLRVRCEGAPDERPAVKDSIAIDGVCLTATAVAGDLIAFDVVPETLARSALGERLPGDLVNVEYALRLGERLGGHLVYGHVDSAPRLLSRTPEGRGARLRIERPPALRHAIVDKAFVALDGVSVTVAAAADDWFEIAAIPETLARTTLGNRKPGSRLNLEIDPIARYAASVPAQRG